MSQLMCFFYTIDRINVCPHKIALARVFTLALN